MKTINEEVARCIKSIGKDLIKRADDIARDLENVSNISIYSLIEAGAIINYDVSKNYNTSDFIHYDEIKRKKEYEKTIK